MMAVNNYQQPPWMAPPYYGARPYEENPVAASAPAPKLTRSSSNTSLYSRSRQPDFSTISVVSGRRAMASSPTASVRSKCKSLPGRRGSSQDESQEEEEDDDEKCPENAPYTWECEHCTYVNPEGTRVCSICCKTPSADFHPAPDAQQAGRRTVKPASSRRGTAKQQIASRREMRANEERRRPSEVVREPREPDYSEVGRRSLQRRRKSKAELNGYVESSTTNNNHHHNVKNRHRGKKKYFILKKNCIGAHGFQSVFCDIYLLCYVFSFLFEV